MSRASQCQFLSNEKQCINIQQTSMYQSNKPAFQTCRHYFTLQNLSQWKNNMHEELWQTTRKLTHKNNEKNGEIHERT